MYSMFIGQGRLKKQLWMRTFYSCLLFIDICRGNLQGEICDGESGGSGFFRKSQLLDRDNFFDERGAQSDQIFERHVAQNIVDGILQNLPQ